MLNSGRTAGQKELYCNTYILPTAGGIQPFNLKSNEAYCATVQLHSGDELQTRANVDIATTEAVYYSVVSDPDHLQTDREIQASKDFELSPNQAYGGSRNCDHSRCEEEVDYDYVLN